MAATLVSLVVVAITLDLMWSQFALIVAILIQLVAIDLIADLMWSQFAFVVVALIQVQFDLAKPPEFYVL